jgi:hypothetical protein
MGILIIVLGLISIWLWDRNHRLHQRCENLQFNNQFLEKHVSLLRQNIEMIKSSDAEWLKKANEAIAQTKEVSEFNGRMKMFNTIDSFIQLNEITIDSRLNDFLIEEANTLEADAAEMMQHNANLTRLK